VRGGAAMIEPPRAMRARQPLRPLPSPLPYSSDGKWFGVDIENEGICDTFERGVWEPASSKINSFGSAAEAACLILSVDETIKNPKTTQEDGGALARPMRGAAGGAGIARGAPMSAALGGQGLKGMARGAGVRAFQGRGGK